MRGRDNLTVADVRRGWCRLAVWAVLPLALLLTGCSAGGHSGEGGLANPPHTVSPSPNYTDICAPIGADTSSPCLRITLEAIDTARAAEGLGPMRLPSDFGRLTVPEQLFVAIDSERVDRGLAPVPWPDPGPRRERPERRRRRGVAAPPGRGATTLSTPSGSVRSTTASMPTSSGCTTTAPTAASRIALAAGRRGAGPTGRSSWTGSGPGTS